MEQQQDLLQDLEQDTYLERAAAGLRFVNLLLDVIVRRMIFWGISVVIAIASINMERDVIGGTDYWSVFFISYLYGLALEFFYYTILEGSTKGRSIGKYATGTKAINNDGTDITWQTAAMRSLCRMVPFEPLSAFGGYPWHDAWTNTQVVKTRR